MLFITPRCNITYSKDFRVAYPIIEGAPAFLGLTYDALTAVLLALFFTTVYHLHHELVPEAMVIYSLSWA